MKNKIAIHEAAHVIVARALNFDCSKVTIEPDDHGHDGGAVIMYPRSATALDRLTVAYGGIVAEGCCYADDVYGDLAMIKNLTTSRRRMRRAAQRARAMAEC